MKGEKVPVLQGTKSVRILCRSAFVRMIYDEECIVRGIHTYSHTHTHTHTHEQTHTHTHKSTNTHTYEQTSLCQDCDGLVRRKMLTFKFHIRAFAHQHQPLKYIYKRI